MINNDNKTNEEIEIEIINNENKIEEINKSIKLYEEILQETMIIKEETTTNNFIKKFDETHSKLPLFFQKMERLIEIQNKSIELQEKNFYLQEKMFQKAEERFNRLDLEIGKINTGISDKSLNTQILNELKNKDFSMVEKEIKANNKKQMLFNTIVGTGFIITISLLGFLTYSLIIKG